MAGLEAAGAHLGSAYQRLSQRWADTRSVWNDAVQQQFEKEYWSPLANQVVATGREMERHGQGRRVHDGLANQVVATGREMERLAKAISRARKGVG